MNMFVLLSRFQKPIEEVNRFLAAHSVWVQQHYESGHFLVSGRREPPVGGVIIARAESEQELRGILALDPIQQMGLAEYEIIAFEAAAFPKRSYAFDLFATNSIQKQSSTEDRHTRG
jgi:uncharacterized protein YciI